MLNFSYKMQYHFLYNEDETVNRIANNSIVRGAIPLTRNYLSYFNLHEMKKNGEYVSALRERIQSAPFCMYLQKNSFLLKPINDLISSLTANGIIDRLVKNFLYENCFKHYTLFQPKSIKLMDIEGIFQICELLYIIAIIVFVIELLFVNIINNKFLK